MKRVLSLLFVLLLLSSVLMPVTAFAGKEPYPYTIRVFAGNMGKIDGEDVVTYQISYDEVSKQYPSWVFDIGSVTLTNNKYYVKGIRESGLDNDTVSNPAFPVTRDIDFVVAYGVKGDEVAYTVSFVRNSDGTQLDDSVTYYGNVGDKPVVACKFIQGYYPRYYNITGTLSDNAASNQFVFRYEPMPVIGTADTTVVGAPPVNFPAQGNVNQPANGNQNAGNGAGTGENAVQTPEQGGEAFPPQPESILDMDVPLAEAEGQGGEKNKLPGWIVLLLVLAAAGLVSIPFVIRQLRKNGKNEEADRLEKAYEEELKKKEDKK